MNPVYILDAVRTPRGRGKAGKGALSGIHPQELLAQVLNAPRRSAPASTGDVDDVDRRLRLAGRRAGREHRAQRGARGRLARRGHGRDAQPLLRLGPAGGATSRAMGVVSGAHGARRRRRRREHVARADGLGRRRHRRQQRAPARARLPGAAGHQRRPHRHARGLLARGRRRRSRCARSRAPRAPSRRTASRKRSFAVDDPRPGKVAARRATSTRAPARPLEGLAALEPAFVGMGARPSGRTARRSTRSRSRATRRRRRFSHVHTAGNSSGIVDGAAAVVARLGALRRRAHGLKPRARIRAMATVGRRAGHHAHRARARPARRRSRMAGMKPRDIDLWEINEAFAAVVLQTDAQARDRSRARQRQRRRHRARPPARRDRRDAARHRARRARAHRQARRRCVTLCIGGGQGIATIIERV